MKKSASLPNEICSPSSQLTSHYIALSGGGGGRGGGRRRRQTLKLTESLAQLERKNQNYEEGGRKEKVERKFCSACSKGESCVCSICRCNGSSTLRRSSRSKPHFATDVAQSRQNFMRRLRQKQERKEGQKTAESFIEEGGVSDIRFLISAGEHRHSIKVFQRVGMKESPLT